MIMIELIFFHVVHAIVVVFGLPTMSDDPRMQSPERCRRRDAPDGNLVLSGSSTLDTNDDTPCLFRPLMAVPMN